MKQMLCGDGEAEPNPEQVSQFALEICKEDVLSLFVQKLPSLGWEVSLRIDISFVETRKFSFFMDVKSLLTFVNRLGKI